jgi:hypothetical protein
MNEGVGVLTSPERTETPKTIAPPRALPAEGSAAWQAEQIAQGNVRIHTVPRAEPLAPVSAPKVRPKLTFWGVIRYARWARFAVALLILVGGGVKTFFFGGDDQSLASMFTPLSGYEYQTMDPDAEQMVEDAMKSVPGGADFIDDFEARTVTRSGSPAAVVMIAGVDDVESNPFEGAESLGLGFVKGSAAGPEGSFDYWEFPMPPGYELLFWDDDAGALVAIVGLNQEEVRTIGSQIGLANL